MNAVTAMDVHRPFVEDTNLEDKVTINLISDYHRTTNHLNRTSPSGETYDGDTSDHNESYPTHVSPNGIPGPYVSDESDSFDGERSCPESVASSLICGDNIKKHVANKSPHLSDDSVTLPVSGECAVEINKPDFHHSSQARDGKISVTPLDDETFIISSSASLLTEDYERIPEPMKARVQYHRRKRLEWKLHSSNLSTAEHKCQETSNSWTVYDDLLEEIEESIDTSGRRCDPALTVETAFPLNGPYHTSNGGISATIENYLNQRFLNFSEEPQAGLCYRYLPPSPTKTCTEISTMTEPEEKEDDDSARRRKAQCLPLCRCMPKK
ncbi:hypothetical protein FGIG_03742 [Fasciola gigantica]|uniref:Uncharacterized protein n=1 Tax=Fasciola gigantica TaxID=46835 RepID=A0A504YLF4_FASGI|nr:hypothetical protein FGIG_03742 [Fasciola gigantica]